MRPVLSLVVVVAGCGDGGELVLLDQRGTELLRFRESEITADFGIARPPRADADRGAGLPGSAR
jgi:hypothetical protein